MFWSILFGPIVKLIYILFHIKSVNYFKCTTWSDKNRYQQSVRLMNEWCQNFGIILQICRLEFSGTIVILVWACMGVYSSERRDSAAHVAWKICSKLAFPARMPRKLPESFRTVLEWFWGLKYDYVCMSIEYEYAYHK